MPNYLSELPEDPFDGGSIKFNIDAMRIYSIGGDFIDAQGMTDEREKGRTIARQHYEIYLDIPEYQRNPTLN